MHIASLYSHLHGEEYLLVRRPAIWREIKEVIQGVEAADCRVPISHGGISMGKRVCGADLNRRLCQAFVARGWHHASKSVPTACGTVGLRYVRSGVGLEVQVGERTDKATGILAEHLAAFIYNEIDVGVQVAPGGALKEELGECTGTFEQCLDEIRRFPRGQPAVPLVLVGVSP